MLRSSPTSAAPTLARPRAAADLIARPQLVRRLRKTTASLIVLRAPVGYGKSVLLRQWAQQDPRPFTWIERGSCGDDPGALTVAVAEQLEEAHGPRVLVLDDPHVLHDAGSLALLADIVAWQPAGSRLVVASRGETGLPLGLLRVDSELLELDAADLAMSEPETSQLLRLAGVAPPPAALARICERCEGWPAGLRLAALALRAQGGGERVGAGSVAGRARADGDRAAAGSLTGRARRDGAGFDGADGFVADYLRDTLLAELPAANVVFLRRCAVLGELSGPLCDAVLERQDCGERLRALARAGLPLTTRDRGERRFRLHPLLADLLRAELDRCERELVPELHRRAAAFHVREHDISRALEHALAGGDAALAGELLWSVAPAYAGAGRGRELRDWLIRCDDDWLAAEPALALTAAVERLAAGDRDAAERWADAAERWLEEEPAPTMDPLRGGAAGHSARPAPTIDPLRGGLAAVRAGVARGGARRLLADAQQARELVVEGPLHAVAQLREGAALRLLGETDPARERLERAARRGAVAQPLVRSCALALLALSELEAGDRAEALALAETAVGELAAAGLAAEPGGALVHAAAACARACADGVEQARDDVHPPGLTEHARDDPQPPGLIEHARDDAERAGRLLAALADPAPWFAAETRIALARALLRLSDAAAARAQLQRTGRLLRVLHDATGLRARLDDAWECADSFAIGAVAGPAALTIAELRVLRFLPSHLSFREIGARLHVSANTVKTQAHAVYRKLDASSRSEAVARATQIGLVEG